MEPGVQRGQSPNKHHPFPLNPNWAQLQQNLKKQGNKGSHVSSKLRGQLSIFGKCMDRLDTKLDSAQINLLDPKNDDHRFYMSHYTHGSVSVGPKLYSGLAGPSLGSLRLSSSWVKLTSHNLFYTSNLQNRMSVTDVIAIDCEMVGVNEANKSALGRVALVNHWGNVIYDEFVRPMDHIVDFRTHVSGIRPRDMKKAKPFLVVQHEVAKLFKGRILVGHSLRNDLKVLLLTHPKNDMRDTLEYKPFRKTRKVRALRHLAAEYLGVEIQTGEHCPVEDARAAMMLYEKNKKEWEKSAKHQAKLKLLKNKHKRKTKPEPGQVANAR